MGRLTKQQQLRLDRILANMGYGTRREVKQMIKDRRVAVDGVTVRDAGLIVKLTEQLIEVDNKPVVYREHIYVMLNKPDGVLSATEDTRDTTVADLVKEDYGFYQPFPVGRLDKDTEGLILLTNDGILGHALTSPKSHVPKIYYVEVQGRLSSEDVTIIDAGMDLGDFITLPGKLEIISADEHSAAWLTIYEGKFHQVKRMMAALGKQVTYLKRLSIGPLVLDPALKLGAYRELTAEELAALQEILRKDNLLTKYDET